MSNNNISYSPTCMYMGEGQQSLEGCCGLPSIEHKSYCSEHVWTVYQQGSNLARRHKDIRRAEAYWNLESEFHQAVEELIEEGEINELRRW